MVFTCRRQSDLRHAGKFLSGRLARDVRRRVSGRGRNRALARWFPRRRQRSIFRADGRRLRSICRGITIGAGDDHVVAGIAVDSASGGENINQPNLGDPPSYTMGCATAPTMVIGLLFFSFTVTVTSGCETRAVWPPALPGFCVRPEFPSAGHMQRTGIKGRPTVPVWLTRNSREISGTSKTWTEHQIAGTNNIVDSAVVLAGETAARARRRSFVCCGVSTFCARLGGARNRVAIVCAGDEIKKRHTQSSLVHRLDGPRC